ncbi:uncharacterized protein LOC117117779 [Anneissia japonica]|uniref:uncharacterized protein LOC117117779 n=1 Tax=Anneissia japonica TaxID=1529436 RepID=UPI001425A3A1|nr:uncharacterized protein LOC117117779 [Anneissia japonica]
MDENGKKKPASKPRPLACMEVLHVLKHHLTDLYPSKCGVSYNLNILCPVCLVGSNQGKHHFQSLDYCLKYDSVPCGTKVMSTAGIRSLFQADLSFSKAIRNFYALQSLTIDLGTELMRKYFMKKGQLRGKHEVGRFLLWQRQNGVLRGVDYGDQGTKIFTADANIDTFDIALLMSLIHHCFSLKGDASWEHPPDDKDTSELANLRRIQLYKETNLDCSHSNQVPDVEFEKQWKELSTIFGGVGVSTEVVQKYRNLCTERPMRGFEQEKVEEIRNFQVILSVVVDVGTATMREYFLEVANQGKTMQNKGAKLNKKDVGQYLMTENRKGSLKNVKIFPEQSKKMFTPTADIETFDISIMYLIIRNCCCSIPYSFWKNPDRLTNLVHIHDYRNTKLAHSPDSRMSTKDFEIEWNKVRSMLHAAGASFNDIDKYKALKFIN